MRLLTEALRSGLSQPVSSVVTGLIVAGVCAAILSTTGQTVQAETEVLARIDAAGTRSVLITDAQGNAGIPATAIERISRISGVEWVFGLGPATDVRAAGVPGGNPAALRTLHGTLPPQVKVNGPGLGEDRLLTGIEAQTTLGLAKPIGGVEGKHRGYAVAGSFTATDPLDFLNRSLLKTPGPDDTILRSVHILAETPDQVGQVADAALMLLAAQDRSSLAVRTSETLADIRAAVQGELGQYGRQLITLVLAAGLILTGLNIYGTINNRRRDLGRRRALGASRPTIIGLITTQTTLTAFTGATLGSLATNTVLNTTTGNAPPLPFTLAIITLATLTATLAALPSATIAAYRDPVRVLRVT